MITKKQKVLALMLCILLVLSGCGKKAPSPTEQSLIEDMVVYYGSYGDEAQAKTSELLTQLRSLNPGTADRWERIMDLWQTVSHGVEIHEGLLPEDLPATDELCLVVLGFQLNPDGTMRDELIERLKVALACAEEYPNAWIVCTGGGTASENESATEAGRMAEYLIENGIAPERVIVEDRSQTTAQNAIYTLQILAEKYPQVRQLAIVSSDYHIATGALLFGAQAILAGAETGEERYAVVSNAAWHAPSGTLSSMFQAGALIELSGDVEKAYDIYFETYDIHELPPLEKTSK